MTTRAEPDDREPGIGPGASFVRRAPRWAQVRVNEFRQRHPDASVREIATATGLRTQFVRVCLSESDGLAS